MRGCVDGESQKEKKPNQMPVTQQISVSHPICMIASLIHPKQKVSLRGAHGNRGCKFILSRINSIERNLRFETLRKELEFHRCVEIGN